MLPVAAIARRCRTSFGGRRLRPGPRAQVHLRRRRPLRHDRRQQPLRGSHRHRHHAVRPLQRRSPGNRSRSPDRSARNADAGKDLPANPRLVHARPGRVAVKALMGD